MAESNKTNSCFKRISKFFYIPLQILVVLLIIGICVIPIFFFSKYTTEAFNDHGLKTNEEMIVAIDSLENNSIALDSVQLRQEIMRVKKLTKYLIERESNYQMEIDLIIDKYSQWTGYWLSIISIVLTLFTIIQALLNHRMNNENNKKIEQVTDKMKVLESDYEEQKERIDNRTKGSVEKIENLYKQHIDKFNESYEEQKERIDNRTKGSVEKIENLYKQHIEKFKESYNDVTTNFKSSIRRNNLSCISACLSTFPDAFSFSPSEERKRFIQTFMKMLRAEYSEFTEYVSQMTDYICKKGENKESNFSEEIRYIYLAWCDICIAINKASLDYTETRQIVAFEELKESLSTAIIMYHNGCVVSTNIAEYMRRVQINIESVVNMI